MIRSRRSKRLSSEAGVDIRILTRIIWSGRWLVAGIISLAAVMAAIGSLMLPDVYKAQALLAPNDDRKAGRLSATAAQYNGLASFAGFNIGDTSVGKTSVGLELLKSRQFISEFIDRRDILVPLMAPSDWDRETGELTIDPSLYDVESGNWVRVVRPPKKRIPSSQEAYDKFMQLLTVGQDKRTGLVTVSMEHYSPLMAKQWIDWLVEDVNAVVRRRDVTEAEQAIEYLNEQIEDTALTGLQSVFFNLIEEKTKTVMLSSISDEYLFETIDPAVVPELKSRPKRALIVIVSVLLGSVLGVASILVSAAFRPNQVDDRHV